MASGTGVLLGAAALTLCSAAPTAPAHSAQELAYQDAAFLFDERHPNQSSGTTVDIDYRDPLDPAAKPPRRPASRARGRSRCPLGHVRPRSLQGLGR